MTVTESARGEGLGHVMLWGSRGCSRDVRGVAIALSSVAASTVLKRRTENVNVRERDGKRRRVRFVTLYRANFGTALENFSLAAFRGKLGEFSTWPIVLHYSDDKVHLPHA